MGKLLNNNNRMSMAMQAALDDLSKKGKSGGRVGHRIITNLAKAAGGNYGIPAKRREQPVKAESAVGMEVMAK